jgi:hypothetical protein
MKVDSYDSTAPPAVQEGILILCLSMRPWGFDFSKK